MFNGLYNGKGGEWVGGNAPSNTCDNFWVLKTGLKTFDM